MIFTFAPEGTVRPGFIDEVKSMIAGQGGEVDFVELVCPLPELKRRIDSPSRLAHQKLASASLFEQLYADGVFDALNMPAPRLSINTSLYARTKLYERWKLRGR